MTSSPAFWRWTKEDQECEVILSYGGSLVSKSKPSNRRMMIFECFDFYDKHGSPTECCTCHLDSTTTLWWKTRWNVVCASKLENKPLLANVLEEDTMALGEWHSLFHPLDGINNWLFCTPSVPNSLRIFNHKSTVERLAVRLSYNHSTSWPT